MTWLLWRQHRVQLLLAAVALAVFTGPMLVTGRHLADAVTRCGPNHTCGAVDVFQGYNVIADVVTLTVMVPLLLGLFWGSTLLGKELESGTATLAWSQSVPRRHWLRTKLLAAFATTLVVSAALTALVTWWSKAHNALIESRFVGIEFDIQALAPVGYSLFSVALGLTAGVLWRRVLPAMATTVVGYIGVRMLVELGLRPHYLAPVRQFSSLKAPGRTTSGEWDLATDVVRHGHVIAGAFPLPAACRAAASRSEMSSCMDRLGYRMRTTYQPAGRYWTFQWIEFGIFAALAVVLVAVALVVLRRRDV
jgi:hypothetical protein